MNMDSIAALTSAPLAVVLGGLFVIAFAMLVLMPNRRIRDLDITKLGRPVATELPVR